MSSALVLLPRTNLGMSLGAINFALSHLSPLMINLNEYQARAAESTSSGEKVGNKSSHHVRCAGKVKFDRMNAIKTGLIYKPSLGPTFKYFSSVLLLPCTFQLFFRFFDSQVENDESFSFTFTYTVRETRAHSQDRSSVA